MILELCRSFYIILYINFGITSYSISNHSNLTRGLKRKSEGSSYNESFQAKQIAVDTSNLNENLPIKTLVSKKNDNDLFFGHTVEEYLNVEMMPEDTPWGTVIHQSINDTNEEDKNKDGIIAELVAEMMRDEKSFIPSNPQHHSNIFNHIEDEERGLLEGQSETIDENPLVVPNSEQNLTLQQFNPSIAFSYSNSLFIFLFLHFPSPNFTADSIRMRFGSGFLSFLSTDQVIRVLAILLSKDLELTKAERIELVEMIFGHIDFSLEMNFNTKQIVSIVTTLLRSDVPNCFEQVFLTWKMWKVFTTEEQEKMLEDVISDTSQVDKIRLKYEKEILVMLYLFVLNKDTVNSSKCGVLMKSIIKIYGGTNIFNDGEKLTPIEYIERNLLSADTFDTSLLDLPGVLKNLNPTNLILFKNLVKQPIDSTKRKLTFTHYGKRYKIHIYYALTKFTQENVQSNNEGFIDVCDKAYFKPEYIRHVFNKLIRNPTNSFSLVNEFRNAYGAIRQIVQSDGYNSVAFLRLFYTMNTDSSYDKTFALILFSLTKKDILRDVSKTPEWTKHMEDMIIKHSNYVYIENVFMYNADSRFKLSKTYCSANYVKCIVNIFHKLISVNKTLHRECYLYQQLLFHPEFEIFNNHFMVAYILSLNDTGQLDNKEKRVQIARDLIFNEYYYKSVVELKSLLKGVKGNLREFRISLLKEFKLYKNETDMEKERDVFKKC
ncbi:hypothetical protein PAEPH01_1132 [Pancytospora epiphaga]|nr:hypothetical protein PAEPH01_1132 [Pancytospora epiphaga]